MSKILLVEDEKNVGSTLKERFDSEGFECSWVLTLKSAQEYLESQNFDLVLLDVGLPDGTGFDLVPILRKVSPSTALVFLTAYQTPENRIQGLEMGAEDYITKPFHFKELLLRVKNILKRTQSLKEPPPGIINYAQIGPAEVSFSQFHIQRENQIIPLTHKECALLKLLFENKGRAISRDEILNKIWSENEYPTPRTVDNFILRLRKLIEINYHEPKIIVSVHGFGYQLKL